MFVVLPLKLVVSAVELNRQFQLVTVEIDNVRTDWVLAPELVIAEAAIAQPSPERSLFER
jgi:hypothetical protein